MLTVILVSDFCKERLPPQFDTRRLVCLSQKLRNFSLHECVTLDPCATALFRSGCYALLAWWWLAFSSTILILSNFTTENMFWTLPSSYLKILWISISLISCQPFFYFSECRFKCISLSRLCNSCPCSHLQVCLALLWSVLPLISFLNVDTISHCLTYKERPH